MVIHHFNRIIRNKWVWGVFAVLISAFFAFDFIFDGRGGDSRQDGAGRLANETVTAERFSACRRDVLTEMRLQYGRELPIKSDSLNREAWSRIGMLKVAEDMHLTASDDDVRTAVVSSFPDGKGGINVMQYRETCARAEMTPEQFEAFIRRQIALARVRRVAATANWISPLEVSSEVRDGGDKITVRIATFQHKNAASVKLDDASLKSYYEANTNSLALPDLVAVKYVKIPADAPARLAKFKITEDELKTYFDDVGDRFGTNAVFATVKPQLEKELKLKASIDDFSSSLYARVCPSDVKADDATDRLAKVAAEEKQPVKESPLFALSNDKFVDGFMTRPGTILPDCKDFLASVSELDPASPFFRYRVIAGSNAVYVVGLDTNRCTKARVPTFAEVQKNAKVRADALADLKAKDFKKGVDAVREKVSAALKAQKTPKLDPKLFGDANVSTSITFVARTAMRSRAFPNSYAVVPAAARLKKGELSELITTGLPGNGVVVYVEDRVPGEAVKVSEYNEARDMAARSVTPFAVKAWSDFNMARLDVKPSSWTSMEEIQDDGADLQD